jgi:hypothetical protein
VGLVCACYVSLVCVCVIFREDYFPRRDLF